MNYPSPDKITNTNFIPDVPNYKLVPENKGELQLFGTATGSGGNFKITISNHTNSDQRAVLLDASRNYLATNFGNRPGITVENHLDYIQLLSQVQSMPHEVDRVRLITADGDAPTEVILHTQRLESNGINFSTSTPLMWNKPAEGVFANIRNWILTETYTLDALSMIEMILPANSIHEITLFTVPKTQNSPLGIIPQQSPLIGMPQAIKLSAAALAALRS